MKKYIPIESRLFPGWFEIPEYSGYCANKFGHILNKKTKNFSVGGRAGRYLKVSAYKDGNPRPSLYYVHDLVCRAFHGLPSVKMVVLHRDNNRANNRPDNLRWGTQSENILQVYQDGLKYSKKYTFSKENYPSWYHWNTDESQHITSLEQFEYVSINSSNINNVGYDKKVKELEVEFKSGNIYIYSDVSFQRFNAFVHSKSTGKYFQKYIRGNYLFKRIQ